MKDDTVQVMLHDTPHPVGLELCNTETCPGISPRAFTHNLQVGFTRQGQITLQISVCFCLCAS